MAPACRALGLLVVMLVVQGAMSTPRTTAASSKASSTKDDVGALLHEAALEEDMTDKERKEMLRLAQQQYAEMEREYYGDVSESEHVPLHKRLLRLLGKLCGPGSGVDCDNDSENDNGYDEYAACRSLGKEMTMAEERFARRDFKYIKDPLRGKFSVPRPCFYDWNRLSSCDDCDPNTVVNPETESEAEMRLRYNDIKGSHFGRIYGKKKKKLRAACKEGMVERNKMLDRGATKRDIRKWCGVQHRKYRLDRESRREFSYIHDQWTKKFWAKVDFYLPDED